MRIGWQTNCAINEATADRVHVGRCWHTLEKRGDRLICPRHGDVTKVQERFADTGKLTSELTTAAEFDRLRAEERGR